jgi:hypothetical protein
LRAQFTAWTCNAFIHDAAAVKRDLTAGKFVDAVAQRSWPDDND